MRNGWQMAWEIKSKTTKPGICKIRLPQNVLKSVALGYRQRDIHCVNTLLLFHRLLIFFFFLILYIKLYLVKNLSPFHEHTFP